MQACTTPKKTLPFSYIWLLKMVFMWVDEDVKLAILA
jgi:hypothetical protein